MKCFVLGRCVKSCLLASLASLSSLAIEVTDAYKVAVSSSGTTVSSGARATDEDFPSDISGVIFRFDASQRDGWEFASGSATKIVKIPSLDGNGRYLTIRTDEGGQWQVATLTSPTLMTGVAALKGGAAVDFGPYGTNCGLVFDPTRDGSDANAPTNALFNVGTVVMVRDSSDGGGWILGGGFRTVKGYAFSRPGTSYSDFIFNNHAIDAAENGIVYQDGMPTKPTASGFTGGWSTVALQPTEAVLDVTGLGINDARWDGVYGGMKIAEAVFYNRVLTADELARVDAYLSCKWFGRENAGYNAFARASEVMVAKTGAPGAFDVTVQVPESQTLEVARLAGGRGAEAPEVTKTGAGALTVLDAAEFAGTVALDEGTLELAGARVLPMTLPPRMRYHVDASVVDSLVYQSAGGIDSLLCVTNLTNFSVNDGPVTFAASGQMMPVIRWNALGTGLHAFDFGTYGSGKFLQAKGNGTDFSLGQDKSVYTVLAVVDARNGGGHLMGSLAADPGASCFVRATTNEVIFSSGLIADWSKGGTGTNAWVWVDGVRQSQLAGYPTPDWHVVAIQIVSGPTYMTNIGAIMTGRHSMYTGGFGLAELVAYARSLSEDEMRDGMAYLAKKWLGKTLPGYLDAANSGIAPTVGNLRVADDAVVSVAGGNAAVRTVSASGTLSKTGAGTFEVLGDAQLGDIAVAAGKVRFSQADDLTVEGYAVQPVLHLDASDLDSFDLVESDGKSLVQCWHDKMRRNAAYAYLPNQRPWRETAEGKLVNGHPYVDFGSLGNSGKTLSFVKSLNSIRSVFVLWGTQNVGGGGFLLGSSSKNGDSNGGYYDFLRVPDEGWKLISERTALKHVWGGEIRMDGVVTGDVVPPADRYGLIEVYTLAPAHASALCCDRDWEWGGQRLCEMILYDRELTDREKTATRDYLMRKWLGSPAQEIPVRSASTIRLGLFSDASTRGVEFGDGVNVTADRISISDGFVKTSEGVLSIGGFEGVTGAVEVVKGVLKVREQHDMGPELVPEDSAVLLDFDATKGVKTVSEGDVAKVDEWASAKGDGWTARPSKDGRRATYVEKGLNGCPTVNMARGKKEAFYFYNPQGVQTEMTGVRSVFWVMGSQEGGGYLLGGTKYDWHRGLEARGEIDDLPTKDTELLAVHAQDTIEFGSWRLNGKTVDPKSATLSGAWDILDMNVRDADAKANGLAMDGRLEDWCEDYMGGQRLAEVILCNRTMSEAEREQIERHLRHKWGFVQSGLPTADLVLATGASLDTSGNRVDVRSLAGNGQVIGGGMLKVMNIWSVGVDGAAGTADCLSAADGTTVSFSPNAELMITFASEPLVDRTEYRILSAKAIDSADIVRGMKINVVGLPQNARVRLVCDVDGVRLKVSRGGLCVIVR